MSIMTIRIDSELEKRLKAESNAESKPRSELVREAISEFLRRREQRRFMAALVKAVDSLDPAESEALAEEALPLANEAFEIAGVHESEAGFPEATDWWK
jgi:predicted DNA-binding protein